MNSCLNNYLQKGAFGISIFNDVIMEYSIIKRSLGKEHGEVPQSFVDFPQIYRDFPNYLGESPKCCVDFPKSYGEIHRSFGESPRSYGDFPMFILKGPFIISKHTKFNSINP